MGDCKCTTGTDEGAVDGGCDGCADCKCSKPSLVNGTYVCEECGWLLHKVGFAAGQCLNKECSNYGVVFWVLAVNPMNPVEEGESVDDADRSN